MSVIIALKQDDCVYVGSDFQCTAGTDKHIFNSNNNYKMWKTTGLDHSITLHAGSARDKGILKLKNFIPEGVKDIDYNFVQGQMIKDIFAECKKYDFVDTHNDDPRLSSELILTYKDKIFSLSSDLTVMEENEFAVQGSGCLAAIGSLESSRGEDPITRIIKAIYAASCIDMGVSLPLVISNTKDLEFKVYSEQEVNDIVS